MGQGTLAFSHSGVTYILGYGWDFFGIWSRRMTGGTLARYPRNRSGWRQAWRHYVSVEPRYAPVQPASPWRGSSAETAAVFSLSGFLLLFIGPAIGIALGYRSLRRMQWYPGVYRDRRVAVRAIVLGWSVLAVAWLLYTYWDSSCVSIGVPCVSAGTAGISWGGVAVVVVLALICTTLLNRLFLRRRLTGTPPRPDR